MRNHPLLSMMLNGERMEVVYSFKYLGSCLSRDGGVKEDVRMRVAEGMRKWHNEEYVEL